MKLRVTGNHVRFILVILNCILLYTHVYWALSNSICCNFPQLIHDSFEGIVFTIEKYMLFHCEIRLPEMEKKFKYWYSITTHPIENKMQAIWNTSASEMIFCIAICSQASLWVSTSYAQKHPNHLFPPTPNKRENYNYIVVQVTICPLYYLVP